MTSDVGSGGERGAVRGVDTSVLVRHFAGDDPVRSPLARKLVAHTEANGERLFVSLPVLCELVWTFGGRRYRAPREEIAALVEGLLDAPVFAIQERRLVRRALDDFRHGEAGFIDYLIGRCGEVAGCAETVTFDEDLAAGTGYRLLTADPGLPAR